MKTVKTHSFTKLVSKINKSEQIKEPNPTAVEFSSVFQKEDRLHPVITVVIYFSTDPWDGPRSVHEMLSDIPPELLDYIPNYKLHLIEPAALSDEQLQKFQSNLREVLLFIKYAKDHGIAVGPGRGSAAGSIVSYTLEITDIDPIKYSLIFERFLKTS